MSTTPSSRLNVGVEKAFVRPTSHVESDSDSVFEKELVRRHVGEVLDGRALDMHIVSLAGGLHKFEELLDFEENSRRLRLDGADDANSGWFCRVKAWFSR